MQLKIVILLCAATLVACSKGGASGGVSNAEPATAAECRAIFEKGLALQGIPADAMGELVDASVKKCVDSGTVTKDDYRCIMAASSESESRACKVDI